MTAQVFILRGAPISVPSDFVGNHWEFADQDPAQGVHWNTHDCRPVRWFDINTAAGVYNWTELDRRVALWGSRPWTYCCWGTPTWASARPTEPHAYGPGRMAEPASMASLGNFVTALVSRYPTMTHIEVWNEPDIAAPLNPPYWYSGSVATFVTMCQTVYQAAKAANPAIRVIGPATVNYLSSPNWLNAWFDAGGAAWVDDISIHSYQMQFGTPLKAFLGVAHSMQYTRNAMSRAGVTRNIYISEFGQTNPLGRRVSEDEYIRGFRLGMVAAAAMGARHACWYHYDGPNFGYSGRARVEAAVAEFVTRLSGSTLSFCALNVPSQTVTYTINGVTYTE